MKKYRAEQNENLLVALVATVSALLTVCLDSQMAFHAKHESRLPLGISADFSLCSFYSPEV
jgi:hypothetical protein